MTTQGTWGTTVDLWPGRGKATSLEFPHKWPWGTGDGSILGWMNSIEPPILMFTRGTGFDPHSNNGEKVNLALSLASLMTSVGGFQKMRETGWSLLDVPESLRGIFTRTFLNKSASLFLVLVLVGY